MIKDTEQIAIITPDREVTFSKMLKHINVYASMTPDTKGERILIFADNSEAWIYAFYSVWANGGIPVPVDASSTVSDVAYIIKDCAPTFIWTNASKVNTVNEALEKTAHKASVLIVEDVLNTPTTEQKARVEYREKDTAVIIYTSGTTGSPKGVMLSFENIMTNLKAVIHEVPIFTPDRRTLILLPLHHVLPLVGTIIMPMYAGGGVAICPSMSGPDIMATLQRGKIAIMIGVPRLWQTLYGGIKKKLDEKWITRQLFNLCSKVNSLAFSRFIFAAVHKKMGGHIKYFVSGGAPLERDIALGLQTLGLELLEGYGMTEAAPMIAFTRPGDLVPKCVGLPLNCMDVKIKDGEICAKGPNIMQGYYNRPEETAAVVDAEGYLHTGDLGHIDEKGRIYITGRSKEIIVLSNGKNVQPAEIEYKLETYTERVKEAAVVQDGDMLKAIIVPQSPWADKMSDEEVHEALKREVLEPYNLTVTNYKKLMSHMVYRGELPRTKLEKLQRFKLKDIINESSKNREIEESTNRQIDDSKNREIEESPLSEEFSILKEYIESEKNITVRPTDHIETDLAMDSLDMVSLEGFIQQTFGTTVKSASMPSYPNILAMAEHIAESKTRMEVEVEDWGKFLNSDTSALELPRASFMMSFLSGLSKILLKLYNRLDIRGVENIPTSGPFIIAPNHQSFLDGPIVTTGLSSTVLRNTYSYATEDHVKGSLARYVARNSNIILMERANLRDSILKMAKVLRQGNNLMIFPEGHRSKTPQMGAFKKTFAILSTELNVPIIPVRITGAFDALPRSSFFVKPSKITVEYLPAIYPDKSLSYDELSGQVKKSIAGE